MANVGTLIVELAASTARFQEDLGKATSIAKQNAQQIERAFTAVKNVLETLGVGISLNALREWGSAILDNAEGLHNLSEETGSSIEQLSKLENAATLAGTSFEELKGILDKFAAGLGGTDSQGSKVLEVMKLLGVSARDPAQAMLETAKALDQFADGANKAALARAAFGRGGVAFIGALKEISENGDIAATKTKEQIDNAVALEKAYRQLSIASHGLRDAFLQDLVPALTSVTNLLLDATTASGGVLSGLLALTHLNIATGTIQEDIARLEKEAQGLREELAHPIGFHFIDPAAELKEVEHALALLRRVAARELPTPKPPEKRKPQAPRLPDQSLLTDAANKILENQLRDLERQNAEERDLLRDRLGFLDQFHQDGLIGIRDFYNTRRQVEADALAVEQENIDKEIALLQKRLKAGDLKPAEREGFEGRITEAIARRSKIEQDANTRGALSFIQETRAVKEFTDSVEELSISLSELTGDQVTATAARFDFTNRKQREALLLQRASGDEELSRLAEIGLRDQERLRQHAILQAQENEQQTKFSNVLEDIGLEQQRISIQVASGQIGEIDGLVKLSTLNASRIAELQATAEAYRKVAEEAAKSGDTAGQDKALLAVKRMEVEIERLQSQTDLLGDKFRSVFHDSFADALTSVIDRTKSLKDAFKDLERSLVQGISRIAANNISDALFGKSGALSGIPNFFSSLFGGKGAGAALSSLTGGGAKDAGLTALTAASAETTASLTPLALASDAVTLAFAPFLAAVDAATIALAAMSATSTGSSVAGSLGKLISDIPFDPVAGFASGTSFAPGGIALVGERGPELVNLPRGAQVFPNDVISGRRQSRSNSVTVNVNVLPGATRASADQAAAAMGLEVRRAMARNT